LHLTDLPHVYQCDRNTTTTLHIAVLPNKNHNLLALPAGKFPIGQFRDFTAAFAESWAQPAGGNYPDPNPLS